MEKDNKLQALVEQWKEINGFINKLDTDNVRFCLDDFFFCIFVDDKAEKEADDKNRSPDKAVNTHIEQVVCACDCLTDKRNDCVCDCGC